MGVQERSSGFRAAYPSLISGLNLDAINWTVFAILFFIAVPFGLYLIQLLILTQAIPPSAAISYFVLTFRAPNFASMFLSNYIHSVSDSTHIYQNTLSSLLLFLMIYFFYVIVLPYVRFRIPEFRYRFNPRAFVLTLIVIFFLVPFSISGISIYFGKILGKTAAWGYSGLLYAFLGFFFYSIVQLLVNLIMQRASGTIPPHTKSGTRSPHPGAGQEVHESDHALLSAFIVFACAFIPFLTIAIILSDMIQPGTGVFAHLGGFMLGFLIGPIIEMITLSPKMKQKIAFGLFLTLVVVVPATFWMAVV
jgi:hypothetical protein